MTQNAMVALYRSVAGPTHALSAPDDPWRPLAERAKAGDRSALAELLTAAQPRVRNLVRYLIRGDEDVDDFAQEALVAVVKGIGTYEARGPVRSWIDRITARLVFAQLRKRKREAELPRTLLRRVPNESHVPPAPFLARRDLVRALDALPQEQRTALVLHHVLGMTAQEVAEELGTPRETVRSRMRLGMQRLRALMQTGEEPA